MKVGDVDRAYLLTMPAGTTAPTPLPLVVDIHGMAEGADVHVKMSGFAALGKAEGFITVFPWPGAAAALDGRSRWFVVGPERRHRFHRRTA